MQVDIIKIMNFDYNAAESKNLIILLTFSGVITDWYSGW